MKISTNKYVTLTYDLHVGEDEERELVEQATIKTAGICFWRECDAGSI